MLKVAIIGCGLIATKKHLPAFSRIKNKARIVAVCDLNAEVAKKAAHSFRVRGIYNNVSDMLLEEKPDIVDICTPPQTHAKLTIEAIEKGANVLLEKPMALNTGDCDLMIAVAKEHRKKIGVIHNQLFNPAFLKARQRFLNGEVGRFLGIHIFLSTPTDYMTVKFDHWAHRLPAGVLGETCPHGVYLALAFLKNIYDVDVQAQKVLPEYPWSDFEEFGIKLFAKNGIGYIDLSYASNQWAAQVDIIGEKGILKIDLQARMLIKYNRPKLNNFSVGLSVLNTTLQTLKAISSNSIMFIFNKTNDAHSIAIDKLINSILEDENPLVTAKDGRETVRVMELIADRLNSIKTKSKLL